MVLDPLQMFQNVFYTITLVISKGKRHASTSVVIRAVDGDPPEASGKSLWQNIVEHYFRYHKTLMTTLNWEGTAAVSRS